MGMYCCCDVKLSDPEHEGKSKCSCDWTDWVSTCDWPAERRNREIPISLPLQDGKYLVRIQSADGDRYEEEKQFNVIPTIQTGGYYYPVNHEIHWEGETWEEGTPYAWKKPKQ